MTDECWTAAEYLRYQLTGIEPTRDKTTRLQTVTDLKDHTEACFQAMVIKIAEENGWMVFHPYDSRRSNPGWPDLALVRGKQLLFWELKTRTGRVSDMQQMWIDALSMVESVQAEVIRPEDLERVREVLA